MMTLKNRILADMKTAMKQRDSVSLEAIRLLRAEIQRKQVDWKRELTEQEVTQVIQKMVKQSTEAMAQFTKGERDDLVDKERSHVAVLENYLPEKLPAATVETLIEQAIQSADACSIKDMGKVMTILKSTVQGRTDMAQVSLRVKSLLSG